MLHFEQFTIGKQEWCLVGKTDTTVTLCSLNSVFKSDMISDKNPDSNIATYEGSKVEQYLNGKFLKKLYKKGLLKESVLEPVTIFDLETVKKIAEASYNFPHTKEEDRWWLKTKTLNPEDKAISNYILQTDNKLNIYKECGAIPACVRAVIKIGREALTPKQDEIVQSAKCPFDETVSRYSALTDSEKKQTYVCIPCKGKSVAHDKFYHVKFNLILCPLVSVAEKNDMICEIIDKTANKCNICTLPDVTIESAVVEQQYVKIVFRTELNANLEEIVANIKEQLLPVSLTEKRGMFALFKPHPVVWYSGFLLDTDDIPETTINEYVETHFVTKEE